MSQSDSRFDFCTFVNEYFASDDTSNNNNQNILNVGSKLYELDDIQAKFSVNHNFMYTAMHLNIHSLLAKFDQLKTLLTRLNGIQIQLDFILLCETFLSDTNANMFDIPGYNFVYKNRKVNCRGGVAIYIKDNIKFSNRPDLEINHDGEFESIVIEANVSNTSSSVIVGEIYRVPNTSEVVSVERYEEIINKVTSTDKDLILSTDQNFDYFKIDTHKHSLELLNGFISCGIIPTITEATRVTPLTSTLIDNIYVKFKDMHNVKSGIISSDISDHFPVFMFHGKTTKNKKEPVTIHTRSLEENIDKIKAALVEIDWSYLEELDVDACYTELTNKIQSILDIAAPLKTKIIYPKQQVLNPWMTKGLMKSSRTLDNLYKKCCGKPKNDIAFTKYADYKRVFQRLKRNTKYNYYTKLLNDYKNDIRRMWSTINNVIGRKKKKYALSDSFVIDGTLTNSKKLIANGFCKYFTGVGQHFAANIPPPINNYKEYLKNKRYDMSFYFNPTDPDEIYKIITFLKGKKSSGHDGITTSFIKQIKEHISLPISIIVNKSIANR